MISLMSNKSLKIFRMTKKRIRIYIVIYHIIPVALEDKLSIIQKK